MTDQKTNHIAILDGIRGGAALWVMIAHCFLWGGFNWIRIPDAKKAVDVFMVISGFLMVYQYRRRSSAEPMDDMATAKKFWIRRFFRIAPVYYLLLAFVFIAWPTFTHGLSVLQSQHPDRWTRPEYNPANYTMGPKNLAAHAIFLFGVLPKYCFSNFTPDWSISLEMQFYAVFPFLYRFCRRQSWILVAAVAVCIATLLTRLFEHIHGPILGSMRLFTEPSFLPLKLPLFIAGMLAAEVFTDKDRDLRRLGLLSVLSLLLSALYSRYVVAVSGLLLWASFCQIKGTVGDHINVGTLKLLGNPLAKFAADCSYSVYLLHMVFVSMIGAWLVTQSWYQALSHAKQSLVFIVLVVSASYAAAALIYRIVELPGIELGRRISRQFGERKLVPFGSLFGPLSNVLRRQD